MASGTAPAAVVEGREEHKAENGSVKEQRSTWLSYLSQPARLRCLCVKLRTSELFNASASSTFYILNPKPEVNPKPQTLT